MSIPGFAGGRFRQRTYESGAAPGVDFPCSEIHSFKDIASDFRSSKSEGTNMRPAREFRAALESVSQNQISRCLDVKSKQLELDVFSIPFNVALTSAPSEFQLKLIKLQSDTR